MIIRIWVMIQNQEDFRALTKNDILQPNIPEYVFRSLKVRANVIIYNLYCFDIGYQQNFKASQPIKV